MVGVMAAAAAMAAADKSVCCTKLLSTKNNFDFYI
jgi:hypothetical protein